MGNWDIARKAISNGNSFSLPEFRKLFHFFKNISQIPRQIKSRKCGIQISLKAQVSLMRFIFSPWPEFISLPVYTQQITAYAFFPLYFTLSPWLTQNIEKAWSRQWQLKLCHSWQEKSIIQQGCTIELSPKSVVCLALICFSLKHITKGEFMGNVVHSQQAPPSHSMASTNIYFIKQIKHHSKCIEIPENCRNPWKSMNTPAAPASP